MLNTITICSGKKKAPSMYRRPSELGLATTPMEDKSEISRNFQPINIGRQHIVKPIPDHSETYHVRPTNNSVERSLTKNP